MNGELQHIVLNGTADYVGALDTLCGLAAHDLFIFEKDLENLGFNSEVRHNTLRDFLRGSPHNRFRLLVHHTRPLTQYCPRLLMLLRHFSHNMQIYRTPLHLQHLSDPFAVADERHFVRRFHFDDPRGILAQYDAEGARALKSRFEEMWAASQPGVTATTLGL